MRPQAKFNAHKSFAVLDPQAAAICKAFALAARSPSLPQRIFVVDSEASQIFEANFVAGKSGVKPLQFSRRSCSQVCGPPEAFTVGVSGTQYECIVRRRDLCCGPGASRQESQEGILADRGSSVAL